MKTPLLMLVPFALTACGASTSQRANPSPADTREDNCVRWGDSPSEHAKRKASCEQRGDEHAAPPNQKEWEEAVRSGEVTMLSSGAGAPCSKGLSRSDETAAFLAARSCWLGARAAASAGLLRIEADVAADGAVERVIVHAWVFDGWFLGTNDHERERAVKDCVERWVREQRYPGLEELQMEMRLNPQPRQ